MQPELMELRRKIAKHRRRHPKGALSAEIRKRALAYLPFRMDQGETLTTSAREIGISYMYAKGLLYEEGGSETHCTSLVRVEITPDNTQLHTESHLELISPTGFRLQGLTLQQALAALKVLS